MFCCGLYVCVFGIFCFVFFFKQKTAYEMRISDWSSDVCSSDLLLDGAVDFRRTEPEAVAIDGGIRAAVDDRAAARRDADPVAMAPDARIDRKSTRLNSSH